MQGQKVIGRRFPQNNRHGNSGGTWGFVAYDKFPNFSPTVFASETMSAVNDLNGVNSDSNSRDHAD